MRVPGGLHKLYVRSSTVFLHRRACAVGLAISCLLGAHEALCKCTRTGPVAAWPKKGEGEVDVLLSGGLEVLL